MPVMTGYEAAKIIKKLKPDLPIIAQFAYALCEREKYEKIFDDYIVKPIDGDYLLQKILKYIEHYFTGSNSKSNYMRVLVVCGQCYILVKLFNGG